MKIKFTEKFDSYVCVNDCITVEVEGFTVKARIEYDQDTHIDDDDSHNVDLTVTGCTAYRQGQLLKGRKAWENDEWFYGTLVLSVSKNEVLLKDYAESLGGLEVNYPGSDNSYLTETANELLESALQAGKEVLQTLIEA